MRTTIRRYAKSCRSCQVNKRRSQKYGHLPPKLVIMTPWKALCVDLIGPYTLKGKDSSSINFMCLTMIDPATSWFKIVELPTVAQETTVSPTGEGKKVTFDEYTKVAEPYFDKSSAQISNLVYKTWFSRYPRCWYIICDNGSEFKLHFQSLCNTYGIKCKPTSVKNPLAILYWSVFMLSLGTCCAHLNSIWPRWWKPVTSTSFYQMLHGPFALPTIQCLKPPQVQQYLDECRKPPRYVPYKCTYDGTFGASDQGQMLDVWQGEDSQIHHLIRQIHRFTISSIRKKSDQKRYRRIKISTRIIDYTEKNQRYFPSNANLVRRSLVQDMDSFWHWRCANSYFLALLALQYARLLALS